MGSRKEKWYTKKPSKKEVKKKKILVCRVGQRCPVCKAPSSVAKRGGGSHISFGDGMASLAHLDAESFLPLECNSCEVRFKKARESLLDRLRKTLL